MPAIHASTAVSALTLQMVATSASVSTDTSERTVRMNPVTALVARLPASTEELAMRYRSQRATLALLRKASLVVLKMPHVNRLSAPLIATAATAVGTACVLNVQPERVVSTPQLA